MKSTGIVRGIDKMGRIVLPKELRAKLHLIEDESAVEFYTEEDMVILKKYSPACFFCDSVDGMVEYKGIRICEHCLKELTEKAKN